jgi:dihydroorotate dehydrogenase electron transfer subunit
MLKRVLTGTVLGQNKITTDIYDLRLQVEFASEAQAGQFVGLYPRNRATLLPRPLSICEVNEDKTEIRLVYRLAGSGTREFSTYQEGDEVGLLGILGNGFPLAEGRGKRVAIIGGGIGIPPLLESAKKLKDIATSLDIFLGYRDNQLFLADELKAFGTVHLASEDGSVGLRGNVLDALEAVENPMDIIMACGPLPMLRGVKAHAASQNIKAYLSLEERMACGIGACLGCVCRTTRKDEHSQVNNARICTEGPVFAAEDVEI